MGVFEEPEVILKGRKDIEEYLTHGEFCFTIIGRADVEGSKSNVTMNAWLPQGVNNSSLIVAGQLTC